MGTSHLSMLEHSLMLSTLQVLSSHSWIPVIPLDEADLEHPYLHREFC